MYRSVYAPNSFLLISNKFWIGEGRSAVMLLDRTSAVMLLFFYLLIRTGGVVWALKPS